MTPADRIAPKGLAVCDYAVYPAEQAIADKICAMAEMHDGRSSSSVKDLVDFAIYATACDLRGDQLHRRLRREEAVRGLRMFDHFELPLGWEEACGPIFLRLASQTGLEARYRSLDGAAQLVDRPLTPALRGETTDNCWLHEYLSWARQEL